MFTQKPRSSLTKLNENTSVLLLSVLFVVGGILLSRHISLALPLMLIFATLLPLFVMRLLTVKAAPCPQETRTELPLLADPQAVEWKQIVGKDGEVVEVGYLKKPRRDVG